MNDFEKKQSAKILACYGIVPQEDILEKGGEGSRGGKVIGHTKSGKPIYDSYQHHSHSKFSSEDHQDAEVLHGKLIKEHSESTFEGRSNRDHHKTQSQEHSMASQSTPGSPQLSKFDKEPEGVKLSDAEKDSLIRFYEDGNIKEESMPKEMFDKFRKEGLIKEQYYRGHGVDYKGTREGRKLFNSLKKEKEKESKPNPTYRVSMRRAEEITDAFDEDGLEEDVDWEGDYQRGDDIPHAIRLLTDKGRESARKAGLKVK